MNIMVTGASGFIGSALAPHLARAGHHVIPLRRGELRRAPQSSHPHWDPESGQIDLTPAGPIHAAIHLAGENIAQRWTVKAKRRIRDSRVRGTQIISTALAKLPQKPGVLLCASATGFYGDRGDDLLTESSPPGTGFLADICQQWEAAAKPAIEAGIRVVNMRFGVVLARDGGALKKMLPLFRFCLGGRVGSGCQYWSWITRDDSVRAIEHALTTDSLSGPINVVSPTPPRNTEFTRALARALHRPAIFAVPAPALRLLLGEMADEALLASVRVIPERLLQSGFKFEDADLEPALRKILPPR